MADPNASAAATKAILIAIIGCGAIFVLPSVLILGIGMTPTLAAMITDRRKEKYATLCVGCMNFTGVLPFMVELWTNDHSYDNAFRLIGEPFTWLVMFGAAAIGWAIYFVAPGIVGMFIAMRADQRVQRLRRRQRDLVEEWGPGVAGSGEQKDDNQPAATAPKG
jgi:ABC-type transport system involved in multi-copper enzyme maturation permease subunit